MTGKSQRVVIVGAGHAGGSAAAFLRQFGWEGDISLIGEEPVLPYQRPPLSKAWLKGEATQGDLELRPADFYSTAGIDVQLGTTVARIDRASKTVVLASGAAVAYSRVIIATGSKLRTLPVPGMNLAPLLELRTMADADRIKDVVRPGLRLIIVGGGYVGLEVAASARTLGATVTVIEREARLLARVASVALSEHVLGQHRGKGVDILLGASVAAIEGEGGRVGGVLLSDGRRIAGDAVLVGIGASGQMDLAHQAGLACGDGIKVDAAARTSDPDIYAIGDCSSRPMMLYWRDVRLESVPNAVEQAKQAASDICGKPVPLADVPWFWSDQFDMRLQMAGLAHDVDRTVVRGNPAEGKFAVFHLHADGCVQAVEAVNMTAEYMGGRLLIGKRSKIDPLRLADTTIPMKQLMA